MIPIHELLNRIRWDAEFGQGDFVIGYYDRILDKIIKVDFSEVFFMPGDRHAVRILDPDGTGHTVPLHRIYEVYRNNELIWHRERPKGHPR